VNEGFYRQTAAIEERHWWFRQRRRLAADWLAGAKPDPVARCLDVGCGTGGNLGLLEAHARLVVGLDRSALALGLAREKHPSSCLVRGDANRLADLFRPSSFDLVTLFNVLYHRWIAADVDRLLITEPALPVLFRQHDRLDFGVRRYRLGELTSIVRAAGLRPIRASYFNAAVLPATLARALFERWSGRTRRAIAEDEAANEMRVPPDWLNRALLALGGAERAWLRSLGGLPLGVGVVLLARTIHEGSS
jgi:SAM-dependent methyltransferase